MKLRAMFIGLAFAIIASAPAFAWSSISCPAGKYDMLSWIVPGPLSGPPGGWYSSTSHQENSPGQPNYHSYIWSTITNMGGSPGAVYQIKQSNGWPWDILKYDASKIYFYETGLSFTDQTLVALFTGGSGVPAFNRCATAGFPGDVIRTSNAPSRTTYGGGNCALKPTYNDNIEMSLWGPYSLASGNVHASGSTATLVLSYRYACDASYSVCTQKEEFYYQQAKGWMWWRFLTWNGSAYVVANETALGTTVAGSTPAYSNTCGY